MRRIVMMVLKLFIKTPYYILRIWWCGKSKKIGYDEGFQWSKYATIKANRAGKVF